MFNWNVKVTSDNRLRKKKSDGYLRNKVEGSKESKSDPAYDRDVNVIEFPVIARIYPLAVIQGRKRCVREGITCNVTSERCTLASHFMTNKRSMG